MKKYNIQYGIGSAKYVVNYHDGISKHKDGSEFWGMSIFKSKKTMNDFIFLLLKNGYVEGR